MQVIRRKVDTGNKESAECESEEPKENISRATKVPKKGIRWTILLPFIFFGAIAGFFLPLEPSGPNHLAVRPFKADLLCRLSQFQGEHAGRMLWGTYRPGLYLGMQTRHPRPLVSGLMWFDPDRPQPLDNIRHLAQERDGLQKYGWEAHDGESFGRQELYDGNIHITTSFAKRFCRGCTGGDWALRVNSEVNNASMSQAPQRISVIFYIADSQAGKSVVDILPQGASTGAGVQLAAGVSELLGGWAVHMHDLSGQGRSAPKLRYLGVQRAHFHNLTDTLADEMAEPVDLDAPAKRRGGGGGRRERHQLSNSMEDAPNLALFQLTAELPLSVDFVFTGSLPKGQGAFEGVAKAVSDMWRSIGALRRTISYCVPQLPLSKPTEALPQRVAALSGSALTQLLKEREADFDAHFTKTFGAFAPGSPKGTEVVAKAALSNTLGGIGYFFGASEVRLADQGDRIVRSWRAALFTAVPSRSFFPRGFIWDEGFHQLLIRRWNERLSRDILAHWLDLLSEEGWIAREQILGEEARARVPAEFIVQSPQVANPPTLFLALADMAQRVAAAGAEEGRDPGVQEDLDFLTAAYPRIEAWFGWFQRTQAGQLPGTFRWRGRGTAPEWDTELNRKTFASGLDDYPRASHPSSAERHVDLYCWMSLASRALASIGSSIRVAPEKVAPVQELHAQLSNAAFLDQMHLDRAAQQYRDWGNHTEAVDMQWVESRTPEGYVVGRSYVRVVGQPPPRPQLVPHFGYVGLFPLLLRMLPADSPQLSAMLAQLRDPDHLWTDAGLRSLSRASSLYNKYNTQHDAPYWRAPIWMNVNYLALAALKHYSQVPGASQELAGRIHDELRRNILRNVVQQYHTTGYLWENYRDESGRGQGSHPFTGWTALVVPIAGETYFEI
ncbi:g1585 [Coccomyxa elongata]